MVSKADIITSSRKNIESLSISEKAKLIDSVSNILGNTIWPVTILIMFFCYKVLQKFIQTTFRSVGDLIGSEGRIEIKGFLLQKKLIEKNIENILENIDSLFNKERSYSIIPYAGIIETEDVFSKANALEILEIQPESLANTKALKCLGSYYYLKNDFQKALNCYKHAEEIFDKGPDKRTKPIYGLYNLLGSTYTRIEVYDQAMRYFNKMISLRDDYGWGFLGKGRVLKISYAGSENIEKIKECNNLLLTAQALFERSLRENPDDYVDWFGLGMTYNLMENHTEGMRCYSRATKIRPKFAPAHYNLAISKLKLHRSYMGDLQRAIMLNSTMREFAQKDPDFVNEKQKRCFRCIIFGEYKKK